LEAVKVKAKRLISTGFEPFSQENSRISRFLPVFSPDQSTGWLAIHRIFHKA